MTAILIQFFGCAAVIVVAGAVLTQLADIISERTKLGRLLIGSILLAGATSLPELTVDISAVRMGAADLAIGDLMGSSLYNLLILAVLDLTRFSHGRMLSEESAAHALAASVSIVLTALAAIFIFLGAKLESLTLMRVGPGPVAVFVLYLVGVRLIYVGHKVRPKKPKQQAPVALLPMLQRLSLRGAVVAYVVGAAVIVITAPYLAKAANDLAEQTGLGGTFFGTAFVALCTSLPELVTTLTAVRMGALDLAVGNIVGSNCFNMAILFPLDLVDEGSLLASVSPTHVYTALCAIVVTAVVVLGHLYRVERKIPFLEPDALLAILLIFAGLWGVYWLR